MPHSWGHYVVVDLIDAAIHRVLERRPEVSRGRDTRAGTRTGRGASGGSAKHTPTASPNTIAYAGHRTRCQRIVCRKENAGEVTCCDSASGKARLPVGSSLARRIPNARGRPRIVWSLIDFGTCRPVIMTRENSSWEDCASRDRCGGMSRKRGSSSSRDAMGIVGLLVASPGMHPSLHAEVRPG